jgi:hypothetical protein
MEETDQISIDYNYLYRTNGIDGFNYNMLMDDFQFNKYSYHRGEGITFDIQSSNIEQITKIVIEKFDTSYEPWRTNTINDVLMDFFVLIANKLVYDGSCCFERILLNEDQSFARLNLIKGALKYTNKYVIQFTQDNKIKIPREKCYILEFPEEICSTKEYVSMLTKIRQIESKGDPMHTILNPTELNSTKGYDTMEHRNYIELDLWKLTKLISWHHRSLYSQKEMFSSYYTALRDLEFKRNKLIIMNHVFKFIENVIEDIFEDTKLNISFTKTVSDINDLIDSFKNGNFSSDDYLKVIREYHI